MTRRWKRILVMVAVMAALGVVGWTMWAERGGQANLLACGAVDPGGSRTDLIQMLGSPTARTLNPAGTRLVLVFRSPVFAPHPVRAVINVRDDTVMEIDCGDGRIRTYDKY